MTASYSVLAKPKLRQGLPLLACTRTTVRLASLERIRLVTLSRNKSIFIPSRFPFRSSTAAKENGWSGSSRGKETQALSIR